MSEFGPTEELLAAAVDRLGALIGAVVAAAGAKPPKQKPWPRPVTAIDRARSRRGQADVADIVARFAPHEVKRLDP